MPAFKDQRRLAAFERLCDRLNSPTFEHSVNAEEDDLMFLSELMNNTTLQAIIGAQDVLETKAVEPTSCDNVEILKSLKEELALPALKNKDVRELNAIISNPHFKALIEAHDDVTAKNFEIFVPDRFSGYNSYHDSSIPAGGDAFNISQAPTDAVRMVGIRKSPDESLGITVRSEDAGLIIARILVGSMIDKQGLLHVGDIIKEINGQSVTNPDQLQEIMKKSNGNVTLKILPTLREQTNMSQIFGATTAKSVFYKAHFTFDPKRDNLIPCRDAGLPFKDGDILQVTNMEDSNWWQANKVGARGLSGLIPSQQLEEKRKAFVRPEYDYTHKSLLCGMMTKKKRKILYQTRMNAEFERTDLLTYEEVTRMPPFQRKTLVLLGAQGVGRRTLKQRLVKADKNRFGVALPHTSRAPGPDETNGEYYWFVSPEEMVKWISKNEFIEHGEFDGSFYGTKIEMIRHCIRQGRMCVLDISPQAAKVIKTSEFMPYIVFIAAPPVEIMRNMHEYARRLGRTDKYKTELDFRATLDESKRIERQYKQYFDMSIVNDNMDDTYDKLKRAIEALSTEEQWVPVTWVY